ncbi:hypothetical protein QTP70_024590, partial [Hemibagrus guttatus]
MHGARAKSKWSLMVWIVVTLSCAFIFCEYVVYFPVILRCSWPEILEKRDSLRVLFLSDPHLLGAIRGHWFDKLRRNCATQLADWKEASMATISTQRHSQATYEEAEKSLKRYLQENCDTTDIQSDEETEKFEKRKFRPNPVYNRSSDTEEEVAFGCSLFRVATADRLIRTTTWHREWQMERSFQTALLLLRPEMIFILGDVFDEGKWSSTKSFLDGLYLGCDKWSCLWTVKKKKEREPKDWEDDVRRFKQIFSHPSSTELVVLIGNHDIGFHHEMTSYKLERFEKVFNITSAQILTKRDVTFLLVNSVALHGDHCPICQGVEDKLYSLAQQLNCSTQSDAMSHYCRDVQTYPSTPPIILQLKMLCLCFQHYPLYRTSDAECTGKDAAPLNERYQIFQERYDVLSQDASKKLLWWFQPRLILSGHTHSSCEVFHENRFPEISVPSFSWRNRNNPSFILVTINLHTIYTHHFIRNA